MISNFNTVKKLMHHSLSCYCYMLYWINFYKCCVIVVF